MEPVIGLDCSPMECSALSARAPIWQDVLAQAMTGELLAAMNYASLWRKALEAAPRSIPGPHRRA